MHLTRFIHYESWRSSESSHSSRRIDWGFYTFWVIYFAFVLAAAFFFLVWTF